METSATGRAFTWSVVYGVNLPVALFLGLLFVSEGSGSFGLLFALLLMWTVGLVVCARFEHVARVLIRGGIVVACTQCFPILQFMSGLAALIAIEQVHSSILGSKGPEVELAVFAVTIMTALPLLMAAFVFGGGHRLLLPSSDPDPEGEPSAHVEGDPSSDSVAP